MNTTPSVSEDALREIIRIVEAVPNRDQWLLWTRRQHQLFRTRSALSGILLVAETALAKASEPYAGQTDVERAELVEFIQDKLDDGNRIPPAKPLNHRSE